VDNLRVELHRVEAALVVRDCGKRRVRRGADDAKAFWQRRDTVAVAHPHLMARTFRPHTFEQRAVILYLQEGSAKLAVMACLHLAAQLGAHGLRAIADGETRDAGLEPRLRRAWAANVRGRCGAARKDDRLGLDALERILCQLERNDFG